MMISKAALKGYLLEEVLAWMLRGSGYRLLVHASQDPEELVMDGNGLCVKGRGAEHQVDVLGEFAFTPAFSLPIRLFLEAKFTRNKADLPVVRNAHGVIHDINENFVHSAGNRLRKRYRYVYALFSTSGFTETAQDFALAQQISLVDLSGASFAWLRSAVESVADELYAFQERYNVQRFPVQWMRGQLRRMLGTARDFPDDESYPETNALWFAEAVSPVLSRLAGVLDERRESELVLGFPAAPFILPLAADNVEHFLRFVSNRPEHEIRLRRTGQGSEAEWTVSPSDQEWTDSAYGEPSGYRLTFSLPERLESWISEAEEHRVNRILAVKSTFLSDIIVYRMDGDNLRTYQLQYQPGELRQRRRRRG